MKMGSTRAFGFFGVGVFLTLACSDGSSAKKAPGGSTAAAPASPLEISYGLAAIRARLDVGSGIELKDDAFTLGSARVLPTVATSVRNTFSVSAPRSMSKPIWLSSDSAPGTWLQVRALGMRDTAQGAIEQGAVVYRAADVDLDVVLSLGSTRLEELRVLRSAKAATSARYALEVARGMQLRASGGRIEALDATGRVAFRTNAAFAVDSAGTMRSVELRLEGSELSTSFDSSGLKYPVVVDPEWVAGPTWPREAVVAQNSAELSSGGTIVGDVTIIQRSSGAFLGSLAPAQLDSGAQLTGALSADSIRLQSGSVITGDAHFNSLSGPGLVRGERFPTLAVPVPVSVPSFPVFTPGTQDITTSTAAPLQLAAGNYRNVNLKSGTTIRLTGGVYAFSAISFGSGSRFECIAACDVRLAGRFVETSGSFFGPAAGAVIGSDGVEVFISSVNGSSSLAAIPAVVLGSGSATHGRLFAPNGTISVASGVQVVGTLVGRDVLIASGAQVVKDNPTAPPTCTANDNNPCTQDSCNAAGQPVFTPLPAGTSCADANICNGVEACNGVGACAPGTPLATDDANPCTTDSCDPASGVAHRPVAAGTSCSDGNACNGTEACNATSQCSAGTPPVLDDGNPCTTDACDPAAGVTHQPVAAGASCSDGNACNGAETCNASGACAPGSPPSIDDGNACTKDSCDPSIGVVHAAVSAGTSCSDGNACNGAETCDASGTCASGSAPALDDGNPCTADSCDAVLGVVHLPLSGTWCSDGNQCNGSELCQAGACAAGTPPAVDDGNPCTADACDPSIGVTHTAVVNGTSCSDGNACNGAELCSSGVCAPGAAPTVDDGNPCTADSCDSQSGVQHTPVATGTSCSDGNACNGSETCSASGACAAGIAPVVDDGNPCTIDACTATSGVTHIPAATGASCDDADVCNGHEACNAIGFCAAGTPLVVDDGNPCTVDTCDKDGVKHSPALAGTSCADANVCNGAEQCDGAGKCAAGIPAVVDDGNPCTADSCDPVVGVKHNSLSNGSVCDDATLCNGRELCQQGACVAGTAPVVDDHNPCTTDSCDALSGVSHAPAAQGTSCADSNLCNGDELCDGAGTCKAGTPVVIDDGNPCTADSCMASGGVVHTPVATGTSCSDSNVCNGSEKCDTTGTCAPGTPLVTDDGNPCTTDSCDPASGVKHAGASDGTSCADANACNGPETCQQGSCAAGTAPVVDDGNPCTADSCDPTLGVIHAPVPFGTSCSDGNVCNGAEVCSGFGQCGAGTLPVLDDGNPCTADACNPTAGITHLPAAAGLSCADGNLCNGDERCDAMGTCLAGTALTVDDSNVCTLDSCDALAGVIHTPLAGCNPDAGKPSQPFETRASIMGRVIDGGGSPVATFTAEVFNDRLDSPARTDVVTAINSDGTFRIRLSSFPESATATTPPQHVLVRIAGDAFPSLLRSAYLRPGDVVALGDLTILTRDPNVTMIGPEGGTAQDSRGTLLLQIPPGALSQPTPVRLTPIAKREQFPTPLPSNTVTMYGMEIEPSGTVLSLPATLRVKNTLNLPTTMKIPVGTIDAQFGDWTHEGFATWDGSRFSTTISHFSPHDCNSPQIGELYGSVGEGAGRNKGKGKDCGVGSSTRYANGGLEQSFDVPLQSAAGHDYSMSLSYTSELSGSVAVGNGPTHIPTLKPEFARSFASQNVRLGCLVGRGSASSCPGGGGSAGSTPCLTLVGGIGIAGYSVSQHLTLFDSDVSQTQTAVPANTKDVQQLFFAPLPDDTGGNPARSGYVPVHMTAALSVGGAGTCVGSGAGFGVSANFNASAPLRLPLGTGNLVDFPAYQLVVHRRGSPLGAGWSFNELGTLYRTPDGASADIVHGDGQQETFHPYPFLKKLFDFQNSSELSFTVDGQTSEVFAASSDLGIRQVNVQAATFTTLVPGTLFGGPIPLDFKVTYVAGQRRFLGATGLGVFEIGSDGSTRQIATFPGTAARVPAVAGLGRYAYFATDLNASGAGDAVTVQRIDLTDPNRTITTITAASGGDLRLDPHGETQAQSFQFLHPAGLAPAFDGGLYVADDRRNAVYHLAPNDAGEVGPDSNVTRILGSGIDTVSGGLGRNLPALEMAIRGPGPLVVAPDGTLFVAARDIGGLAAYDPIAQTGHWVAFDRTANLLGTDSGTLSQITLRAGALAPLAKDSLLVPFAGNALLLTTPLSSQFEPLRTLTFGNTGASVVDAGANVVEQYTWGNTSKTEAQLSAETLRSGEPIRTIAYKDADQVDYVQDAAGGRITFAYDGSGHLSTITDAARRVTRFTIDSDSNLREVIYPSGEARRFDYQDFRMISATHPNGEVSTYSYAPDGTLQTAQRPGGGTTTIQAALSGGPKYDSSGSVYYESLVTDDRGVQHALRVDDAGAVVWDKYTADGQTYDVENLDATALNGASLFETTTNRLLRISNTTVNGLAAGPMRTFDTLGRVSNLTQSPADTTSKLAPSYDATQRLARLNFGVTIIDWAYTYDPAGHLTKVADQNSNSQNAETGRQTLYDGFRAADGQPTTVTSHSIPTTFGYDALGLVNQATDTVGHSLSVVHDAAGNATAVSDGVTTTQYGFDLAGRVTSITDAESNVTTLSYETAGCSCSNGNRVTSIATPDLPAGQHWSMSYDADGDLQTSTTPLGEQEVFVHDARRDLVGMTDRAGRSTTFTYDQLGRQSTIIDPVQRVGVFSYAIPTASKWLGPTLYAQSPTGAPAPTSLTAVLADGQYQVGSNGIQPGADTSHVALYRDATFQTSQWLAMDALDRLHLRTDRSASGLSFDSATPGPSGSSNNAPFVDEFYDYGSVSGSPFSLPFTEATHYTVGGQTRFPGGTLRRNPDFDLTSVGIFLGFPLPSFGNELTVSRDAAGRLTGTSRINSPASSQISYLPNGQLGSVIVNTPALDSSFSGGICDQPGQTCANACNHRCQVFFQGSTTASESFTYDDRGLLKTRTAPGGELQYSYDAVGRNLRLLYPDGHERDQVFDGLGRLTSRCYLYGDGTPSHCYTATYDAVGNPKILTDPETREEISYDDLDRVIEVRHFEPADATVVSATETYAYNALGGFAVYDGVAVDDQRPRLDGAGKASAAIAATFEGAPVVMDGGGSVTSFGQVALQYFNLGHHVQTLTVGGPQPVTQSYTYDALGRLIGAHAGPPSGALPNRDENYIYSDLSNSISATVSIPYNVAVPPQDPSIPTTDWNVGYDGVDHPLWVRQSTLGTTPPTPDVVSTQIVYPELDTIGNVRHLYAIGAKNNPSFKGDLGTHNYSAFGKTIATTGGIASGEIPFGWQGKRLIAPNIYDSRARVWSADLGAFLQPDEYVFLTRTGTLWSWPGQNPFRWRDPSGRDAEEWFLRNADSLQNGALAVSAAALTIATGGLAGELLGLGTLDASFATAGTALTGAARAVAARGAAAAATGLAAARSCGDKAESAVEEGRDALAQLGPKDAEIFRAAQQAAGGPGAFMRDLGALGKAVGDAIPNGKVNLIGDIGGSPVYGSTVTRIGIATVDGVTQIVRAPLDSSPEILGPFHP